MVDISPEVSGGIMGCGGRVDFDGFNFLPPLCPHSNSRTFDHFRQLPPLTLHSTRNF
jgi:hypothetical protein